MTKDADSALAPGELTPLVEEQQVITAVDQLRHIPYAHFLMDVCIAWTAWHAGLRAVAPAWLAIMTVCQVGRSIYLIRLANAGHLSPHQMLVRLTAGLVFLGALHAFIIAAVFSRPVADSHYILTMILVGTAAGAVSPVAGHVRSYVCWAIVFGGALSLGWLAQMTLESTAIAVLIVCLFAILTLFVKDQGAGTRRLVELTARMKRADEAKTRFFAAASHDLRQPLTALRFNAATVQALADRDGNEELAHVGMGIERALDESRKLLDSLLEISELDANAVEAACAHFDIADLMAQVRRMYALPARERGLQLSATCESGERVVAWTDPDLLWRIVQNIVTNAIKFTDVGMISLDAHVDAGGERIVVRVTDTGPGIPLELQERVFEEFFQIGNPERDRSRGIGLGLAITQRLARLIGARIDLRSTPGHGATFIVSLPRGDASRLPAASHVSARPVRQDLAAPRRVLVLDDEAEIRDSLAMYLRTMGWEVAAAANHHEAVQRLQANFLPDVLVLDFRLRDGVSGLDALGALRACACGAPAVLITGDTEPRRIAAALAAGVPVLYKPVDGMKLLLALEQAISAAPVDVGRRRIESATAAQPSSNR